jgi:hypothetical protein
MCIWLFSLHHVWYSNSCPFLESLYFFFVNYTEHQRHSQRIDSFLWTHMRKPYLYEHLRSKVKKLLPSSRYNQWLEGLDPVQIPLSVRTVRTITTVFEPVDTGFCLTCFEDRADKSSRNPTLWASSKIGLANPQDWRSHHRHLAIDGNVTYHWKHKCR